MLICSDTDMFERFFLKQIAIASKTIMCIIQRILQLFPHFCKHIDKIFIVIALDDSSTSSMVKKEVTPITDNKHIRLGEPQAPSPLQKIIWTSYYK